MCLFFYKIDFRSTKGLYKRTDFIIMNQTTLTDIPADIWRVIIAASNGGACTHFAVVRTICRINRGMYQIARRLMQPCEYSADGSGLIECVRNGHGRCIHGLVDINLPGELLNNNSTVFKQAISALIDNEAMCMKDKLATLALNKSNVRNDAFARCYAALLATPVRRCIGGGALHEDMSKHMLKQMSKDQLEWCMDQPLFHTDATFLALLREYKKYASLDMYYATIANMLIPSLTEYEASLWFVVESSEFYSFMRDEIDISLQETREILSITLSNVSGRHGEYNKYTKNCSANFNEIEYAKGVVCSNLPIDKKRELLCKISWLKDFEEFDVSPWRFVDNINGRDAQYRPSPRPDIKGTIDLLTELGLRAITD